MSQRLIRSREACDGTGEMGTDSEHTARPDRQAHVLRVLSRLCARVQALRVGASEINQKAWQLVAPFADTDLGGSSEAEAVIAAANAMVQRAEVVAVAEESSAEIIENGQMANGSVDASGSYVSAGGYRDRPSPVRYGLRALEC